MISQPHHPLLPVVRPKLGCHLDGKEILVVKSLHLGRGAVDGTEPSSCVAVW
jgi:hypothetical protein